MLIISLPKLGRKIALSPHKAQHHSACGQNSKEAQIPKSHYDVANSMSHYDVANSKPATMRHYLQSPLLHGTPKTRFYVTIPYKISKSFFTKPKCLFGIYFYKAQILIWHLFLQSPNTNLALFYKAQILFSQFFHKAQILIWHLSLHYFYKSPNANLASILQSLKPF